MRFIVVSRAAAEAIASDRFLQSCEFEQGRQLAKFLPAGDASLFPPVRGVTGHPDKDGISLVTGSVGESPDSLVIDLEAANPFQGKYLEDDLLIFQKILRFSLRFWSHQKFTASERMLSGSKAVLFPFPISKQSSFRILIDCAPDEKRLSKRPTIGSCLLLYWAGVGDYSAAPDEPVLTVFRKALVAASAARAEVSASRKVTSEPKFDGLGLTKLTPIGSSIDAHVGFDAWQKLLTENQRAFVTTPLRAPHRIEGPAGSGKTISLVLRSVWLLRHARSHKQEHRALFLAHSEATRRTVQNLFDSNDADGFSRVDPYSSAQSVTVTTLHELCGRLLGRDISESEFIDRDAMESKNVQLLYVDQALAQTLSSDFETHRRFLSADFVRFLETEPRWAVAQMVQHEISVVIKGRAEENLEKYRRVPRTPTGMPLRTESDRGFVFVVFQRYQESLRIASTFDTDDVVLSALGQLNTPIWRRRRAREGYDSVFVDETHLFNLNELSVLHHLTRSDAAFPIAYTTDPAQALEDRGWSDELFDEALASPNTAGATTTRFKSVFRCSPDILNLALAVTSSGATLFSNFDDPLRNAVSAFTQEEERQSAAPTYIEYPNDAALVHGAFARAEEMCGQLKGGRSQVAIVAFSDDLWSALKREADDANKPVELLSRRGDIEVLRRAEKSGRFVLTTPEYVGGLEFGGVVLVGVDQGRVPPAETMANSGSAAFLSYQAHSRLYVALTRARFRVELLGSAERGVSRLLASALANGALKPEKFS